MQEKKFKTHKVLFITIPHLKLHFVEAQKEEKILKQASFFLKHDKRALCTFRLIQ